MRRGTLLAAAALLAPAPARKRKKLAPHLLMDIYLPIAEVSLDVFVLLGLGAAIGFLSGVFGVGGGFLLTPLLIFIGVPPAVVSTAGPASASPA